MQNVDNELFMKYFYVESGCLSYGMILGESAWKIIGFCNDLHSCYWKMKCNFPGIEMHGKHIIVWLKMLNLMDLLKKC